MPEGMGRLPGRAILWASLVACLGGQDQPGALKPTEGPGATRGSPSRAAEIRRCASSGLSRERPQNPGRALFRAATLFSTAGQDSGCPFPFAARLTSAIASSFLGIETIADRTSSVR